VTRGSVEKAFTWLAEATARLRSNDHGRAGEVTDIERGVPHLKHRCVDADEDVQILPWTLPNNVEMLRQMNRAFSVAGDLDEARKVRGMMVGEGYGTPPPGSDLVLLSAALDGAFARFLVSYGEYGGHRFHGWTDYGDPENYQGPMFWSEGDCVFRLALELEREFPGQVHLEVPVARWVFNDFNPKTDRRQFVDLVVSDLSSFERDGPAERAEQRFTTHRHEIFIEAKYFPHGSSGRWRFDHIRKIPSILADAERLAAHLERGHCKVAAVLVVDNDNLFEDHRHNYEWPSNVELLVASPAATVDVSAIALGLADELDR
jgi:hypothetical protein